MGEREELLAERAELMAKNAAATSWGAAVGARNARITGIDRSLRILDEAEVPPQDPLSMLLDAAHFIQGQKPAWAAAARKAVNAARSSALAQGSNACGCGPMCEDKGVGICRYHDVSPTRKQLRHLVDAVCQHATDSTAVPATDTADRLITKMIIPSHYSRAPEAADAGAVATPFDMACVLLSRWANVAQNGATAAGSLPSKSI